MTGVEMKMAALCDCWSTDYVAMVRSRSSVLLLSSTYSSCLWSARSCGSRWFLQRQVPNENGSQRTGCDLLLPLTMGHWNTIAIWQRCLRYVGNETNLYIDHTRIIESLLRLRKTVKQRYHHALLLPCHQGPASVNISSHSMFLQQQAPPQHEGYFKAGCWDFFRYPALSLG